MEKYSIKLGLACIINHRSKDRISVCLYAGTFSSHVEADMTLNYWYAVLSLHASVSVQVYIIIPGA